MKLSGKNCSACTEKSPILTQQEVRSLLPKLKNWHIDNNRLIKSYKLRNFRESIGLANSIADVAESQNHHPDLLVRWGELKVILWTHVVNGLTENDFILASKIDQITS